jgi:hypothetical protein
LLMATVKFLHQKSTHIAMQHQNITFDLHQHIGNF